MDNFNEPQEQNKITESSGQLKPYLLKSMLWNIRIDAVIIIAAVIISNVTDWLEKDTINLIIMLMALFILSQSLQPEFQKRPRLRTGIIIVLAVLLAVGVVIFFLAN